MDQKKLNVETLIYCSIFLLAILVRFVYLGQAPMNDYESVPALQATAISRDQTVGMGDQPAYVMLTAAVFRILDSTNFLARFWPALAGATIVLVPFLLRSRLPGKMGLIIALFLTLDPALVAISRTAGGQSLAVVFSLLTLAFLVRRMPIAAGFCLGAALASGSAFWLGLVVFLVVLLVTRILGASGLFSDLKLKDFGILVGIAALTAVVLSSGLMILPGGISGIANGLVSFAKRWDTVSLVSIKTALIVFAATYLPGLLLGGFGYFAARRQQPVTSRLLLVWFIVATMIVILMPSREINDWVWAALPLWGLTAMGIITVLPELVHNERYVLLIEVVLTVSMILFSVLNLMAYYFNSYGDAVVDRNRLIGAGLPILLLIIVTAFMAWGWSPRSAIHGFELGVGMLLCVWVFSNAMKSAGFVSQPSAMAWKPQPVVADENLLVSQVEDLSMWNHGQRQMIDIEVVNYDTSSMHWALRRFSSVTWDLQYSPVETPSVIIAPDYQQIGSTTLYRGQGVAWAQYPSFAQMKLSQWMRWIFYRQAPVDEVRLILYARNDLFKQ